uniref:Uncharacterized protein n=1 Tax=Chromera velia CCMP2878 TaxID=1169474 RepID=A0A0K6S9Y5_9ALVE|eukprot:Cvel_1461.t2-p1 / transcript=Cvel_1461.t2 / gene=Cvel_1461 / organism=Chromera_velia_CCMP2878 / gene_product=hypothetical protein / transcript_product=hypothetical protein / location=Cvel_scaffold51:69695-76157(-) / protein_length=973 / sequence_SO=supercontig / SO=protein_coding / is_pseudo=false
MDRQPTGDTLGTDEGSKAPYFEGGEWYLNVDTSGVPLKGVLTQAPKKKDRLVLEFTLPDGKPKKFYNCNFCREKGDVAWVFHKNYVHQHIPRHHRERCIFCESCKQYIFNEIYELHVRTCEKRGRAKSQPPARSSGTELGESDYENEGAGTAGAGGVPNPLAMASLQQHVAGFGLTQQQQEQQGGAASSSSSSASASASAGGGGGGAAVPPLPEGSSLPSASAGVAFGEAQNFLFQQQQQHDSVLVLQQENTALRVALAEQQQQRLLQAQQQQLESQLNAVRAEQARLRGGLYGQAPFQQPSSFGAPTFYSTPPSGGSSEPPLPPHLAQQQGGAALPSASAAASGIPKVKIEMGQDAGRAQEGEGGGAAPPQVRVHVAAPPGAPGASAEGEGLGVLPGGEGGASASVEITQVTPGAEEGNPMDAFSRHASRMQSLPIPPAFSGALVPLPVPGGVSPSGFGGPMGSDESMGMGLGGMGMGYGGPGGAELQMLTETAARLTDRLATLSQRGGAHHHGRRFTGESMGLGGGGMGSYYDSALRSGSFGLEGDIDMLRPASRHPTMGGGFDVDPLLNAAAAARGSQRMQTLSAPPQQGTVPSLRRSREGTGSTQKSGPPTPNLPPLDELVAQEYSRMHGQGAVSNATGSLPASLPPGRDSLGSMPRQPSYPSSRLMDAAHQAVGFLPAERGEKRGRSWISKTAGVALPGGISISPNAAAQPMSGGGFDPFAPPMSSMSSTSQRAPPAQRVRFSPPTPRGGAAAVPLYGGQQFGPAPGGLPVGGGGQLTTSDIQLSAEVRGLLAHLRDVLQLRSQVFQGSDLDSVLFVLLTDAINRKMENRDLSVTAAGGASGSAGGDREGSRQEDPPSQTHHSMSGSGQAPDASMEGGQMVVGSSPGEGEAMHANRPASMSTTNGDPLPPFATTEGNSSSSSSSSYVHHKEPARPQISPTVDGGATVLSPFHSVQAAPPPPPPPPSGM